MFKKSEEKKPAADEMLFEIVHLFISEVDPNISENASSFDFVGVIKATGSRVIEIKLGDKVIVPRHRFCEVPYCSRCRLETIQNIDQFQSGNCRLISASDVIKIPDEIPLQQGMLLNHLSLVAGQLERVGPIKIGQNILIQGCGLIGSFWAAVLHLQGHKKVIVEESQEGRRRLFQKLGTEFKCLAPEEISDYEADVVVETSGEPRAIEKGFELLAKGGKMAILGVSTKQQKIRISPYHIVFKELTIVTTPFRERNLIHALGLLEAFNGTSLDFDNFLTSAHSSSF